MKKIFFFVFLFIQTCSVWANVVVFSAIPSLTDSCQYVIGPWEGTGLVSGSFIGIPFTCRYHSEGQISGAVDSEQVSTEIHLQKEAGMFCPEHETVSLSGTCHQGVITLQAKDADLHGTLSEDGQSAEMAGTVGIDAMGQHIVTNVHDMHLHKKY